MRKYRFIDPIEVKKHLKYDPKTGRFTALTSNRKRPAGFVFVPRSDNYQRVPIGNTQYAAHRVAWVYMTGDQPKGEIDHINGRKWDNRWKNLRDVTTSENVRAAHERCKLKRKLDCGEHPAAHETKRMQFYSLL